MSIPGSCHIMLVDKSDGIGTGALSADFTQGAEYKMILVHSLLGVDALKHAPANTQTMGYPNDGVLKVLILIKSRDSFYFRAVFFPERPRVCQT